MTPRDARRWPIGTIATMRDCYGVDPITGRVVAHLGMYAVTLRTPDGIVHGGTSLLEPPTVDA